MFDREVFRENTKKILRYRWRGASAAFALRISLRTLPLYVFKRKKLFWFWSDDKKKENLLLLFRAYNESIEYSLTVPRRTADHAYSLWRENTLPKIAAIINGVRIGACAQDTFWHVDSNMNNHANCEAGESAADVAADLADNDALVQAMQHDLEKLDTQSLLEKPLWPEKEPLKWRQLYEEFKIAVLNLNAGFEVWLDWYDERLQGIPIDVNLMEKWNGVPWEINQQGVKEINAYLKSLSKKTVTRPLNYVRVILLGYGEAGKTSLVRALHEEDVIRGKEKITPGIEIRDWLVPDTEILAHLWDFGGQVVFHSTHRFFLRSSCVYIIVLSARADINSSEQAEYWLDHVKVYGSSSPVLLVANKADEAQAHNLQMQTLSNKYPNIKGFYPISCTEAKTNYLFQFNIFKQALVKEIKYVCAHQMLFSQTHSNVLDELRHHSLDHTFLSEDDFNGICDKHGVSNEGTFNRAWLMDIFDKLGVMLHFDELKTFHSAYMLNPRWLTHGVYSLMNSRQARLSESDIVHILRNVQTEDEYKHLLVYPAEKCQFIIKAMQHFGLCYPLSNNLQMIPVLLPDELPSLDFVSVKNNQNLTPKIRFEFNFNGFFPRNLISEFIVNRYEEIKGDQQSQRGAVFSSKSLTAEAIVEADFRRHFISMQIYGRDAREYLTILYDAMLAVFGDLKLEYREWVYLPLSACINSHKNPYLSEKAEYKQLIACAKAGQNIYITGSELQYDLAKVLGSILSKEGQKRAKIKIYGDVIKGDKRMNTQKIKAGKNISVGNGSFNFESKIHDSFNRLQESKSNTVFTKLLHELLTEIKALNGKIPIHNLTDMVVATDNLISECNREMPRKEWYQFSLKSVKEAALSLKQIGEPILDIVTKLNAIL